MIVLLRVVQLERNLDKSYECRSLSIDLETYLNPRIETFPIRFCKVVLRLECDLVQTTNFQFCGVWGITGRKEVYATAIRIRFAVIIQSRSQARMYNVPCSHRLEHIHVVSPWD
jgi:hypothetical protein